MTYNFVNVKTDVIQQTNSCNYYTQLKALNYDLQYCDTSNQEAKSSYLAFNQRHVTFRKLIHDYIQLQSLDEQNSLSTGETSLHYKCTSQLAAISSGQGAQPFKCNHVINIRITYGAPPWSSLAHLYAINRYHQRCRYHTAAHGVLMVVYIFDTVCLELKLQIQFQGCSSQLL
ncbi:Hypothetical_protein [Hexamita inflata]|uniref:Hypothetical_protein n=1 Tax=Hexamita inflata TaxID=28002 RepID=A0AA86PLT7_9EUKA|nr:Hypothetical protein HINF_LOCUS27113 [Hexamita inflata]